MVLCRVRLGSGGLFGWGMGARLPDNRTTQSGRGEGVWDDGDQWFDRSGTSTTAFAPKYVAFRFCSKI